MLVDEIRSWGRCDVNPPASAEVIGSCERELGHGLPGELRELLREADGIEGEYGLGVLWSAQLIADENSRIRGDADVRRMYDPLDGFVFFSDAGNGEQFAMSRSGSHEVYCWNQIDDTRTPVASDLRSFFRGWMTGGLTI